MMQWWKERSERIKRDLDARVVDLLVRDGPPLSGFDIGRITGLGPGRLYTTLARLRGPRHRRWLVARRPLPSASCLSAGALMTFGAAAFYVLCGWLGGTLATLLAVRIGQFLHDRDQEHGS